MTAQERRLYHQIHPAKLASDAAAGAASVIAFSSGRILIGLFVAIAVPVAASLLAFRYTDLERLKRSRLGAYVNRFMTPAAQAQRVAGFGILSYGAWGHSFLLAVFGAALIMHAWTMGVLIPRDVRK